MMKDEGMSDIQLNQDANPYMQRNFRPVQEEVTEFELEGPRFKSHSNLHFH